MFEQVASNLPLFLQQNSLLLPSRAWKVKFVGERVDDCGGGYTESVAEMCDELHSRVVPLLATVANDDDLQVVVDTSQDVAASERVRAWFQFFGL